MRPVISEYLGWLFRPFFRWWWAAVSGTASIGALLGIPESGVTLSGQTAAVSVLVAFGLAFLSLSVLVQGWSVFQDRVRRLEVLSIRKDRDFNGGWIYLLSGHLQEGIGTLIEIQRTLEETEVPFAIVRVVGTTEKGYYQAVPLWTSPGHQRDFMRHRFSPSSLRARTTLTYERALEVFSERGE